MYITRFGSAVAVHAPAKLNLSLEVLAKRSDGYHELETLMTAIDIFDTLFLTNDPTGAITLNCRWTYGWNAQSQADGSANGSLEKIPPSSGNIVTRALQCLRQSAGIEAGARVELIKRIPSAAGLGGASSDAAAALLGANEIWKLGWSTQRLAAVAAEVGSDVPFFLRVGQHGSGAAVCSGRGEKIEPTYGLSRVNYVVVKPPQGLSTPEVFKRWRRAENSVSASALVATVRGGNPTMIARALRNGLESPAAELSTWITRLVVEFKRVGSLGSRMSGSGSSCFGVFRHRRQARRAGSRLRAARIGAVHVSATAAAPRRRSS